MPLAHWNNCSIFFAHVPKTGGSSVEDYLIRRFGPLSIIDVNIRTGVRSTGPHHACDASVCSRSG